MAGQEGKLVREFLQAMAWDEIGALTKVSAGPCWAFWRNNSGKMRGKYQVGVKGSPDVIGWVCGLFLGIEFKDGSATSLAQKRFRVLAEAHGAHVYTANSTKEAIWFARNIVAAAYSGPFRQSVLDKLTDMSRDIGPGLLKTLQTPRKKPELADEPQASTDNPKRIVGLPGSGNGASPKPRKPPGTKRGRTTLRVVQDPVEALDWELYDTQEE